MKLTHSLARVTAVLGLLSLMYSPRLEAQERADVIKKQDDAIAQAGYYALVIGSNDYQSLAKLKTAETDAREVAALLRDSYGFETKLLLNATRSQIFSALLGYRQTLGPETNLLIYYAGHGVRDKEAEKAYWLPVDATRDDDSNWISADDITTRLRAIPARHILVISDSCYSGSLNRELGEARSSAGVRQQFIRRMMAGHSRTLMASGGDEPVADGGGGQHSIFAGALLKGLREMDKPMFTAGELFTYHVEEQVAGKAQQLPEYNPIRNSGHEAGDFVFVRVKTDMVSTFPSAGIPEESLSLLTFTPLQSAPKAQGTAFVWRGSGLTTLTFDVSGLAKDGTYTLYALDSAQNATPLGTVEVTKGSASLVVETPLTEFRLVLSTDRNLTKFGKDTKVVMQSAALSGKPDYP